MRTNEAARYSREMFLDCIYFEPVTDHDALAILTSRLNKQALYRSIAHSIHA